MTITPLSPHSSTTMVVEITVTSIEGLNNYTSCFNPTIKPFITHTSISTVDDTPTPRRHHNHKFRVPLDPTFQGLHLQLFNKRRNVGTAELGWCVIPASDIGLLTTADSVRYLSYRVRGRDGSMGHAIINVSVRLEEGHVNLIAPWKVLLSPTMETCHTVIGLPVTAIRGNDNGDCSCRNTRITR